MICFAYFGKRGEKRSCISGLLHNIPETLESYIWPTKGNRIYLKRGNNLGFTSAVDGKKIRRSQVYIGLTNISCAYLSKLNLYQNHIYKSKPTYT